MKNTFFFLLLLLAQWSVLSAQNEAAAEPTGLPGDNFSLEGALELFRQAQNPEEFEKLLNSEDQHVNNIDLNEDGETDYIRVIETHDKDVRVFVLQVPVSDSENQDIAVIGLEKTGKDEAVLQIIGDEEIFGEEMIVEPSDGSEEAEIEGEDKGPAPSYGNRAAIVVNVWGWPCVRFVYAPGYRPWISPWRWRHYPTWWRPWRPLGWAVWHPFRVTHYRPTVRVVHSHRVVRAHRVYKPTRVSSTTVRTRTTVARNNYKVTRTKTKVTGPRGNSVTKKTTTVKGRNGNVRAKRTTVKGGRG